MFLTGYYIPARIHKKKLVLAGCGPPAEKKAKKQVGAEKKPQNQTARHLRPNLRKAALRVRKLIRRSAGRRRFAVSLRARASACVLGIADFFAARLWRWVKPDIVVLRFRQAAATANPAVSYIKKAAFRSECRFLDLLKLILSGSGQNALLRFFRRWLRFFA